MVGALGYSLDDERRKLAALADAAERLVVAKVIASEPIHSEWDEVIAVNPGLKPVLDVVRAEETAPEREARNAVLVTAESAYMVAISAYQFSLYALDSAMGNCQPNAVYVNDRAKAAGKRLQEEARERLGITRCVAL